MLFRADRGEMLFDPSDLSLQLTRGAVLKLLQPPASRDDEEEPNYRCPPFCPAQLCKTLVT